jgi:hypothetical protein
MLMKKLSLYIFLGLICCNVGFANNVKDFQIEGVSVGDKLDKLAIFYPNFNSSSEWSFKEPALIRIDKSKLKIFDDLYLYLVERESKKIGLINAVKYTDSIQECINIKKEIEMSLITEFKGAKLSSEEYKSHALDSSGKSKFISTKFSVSSKDDIIINCYDWSKEIINKHGWKKLLAVQIKLPENETIPHEKIYGKFMYEKIFFESNKKKFTLDEKYYALLIGNSNYDNWENLISPNNDINVISSILKDEYNFNVEVIKDSNRNEILDKIFEYSNKITDKDNLLIYYVGHGEIVNSNAYWIPKNGTKEISSTWLNTKDVESAISMISAKDLLVMIDACYQGTAFKSGSENIIKPTNNELNDDRYFNKMLNFRSSTVITSGSDEPVVDSTIEGHSHFAFKFIDILKKNNKYETSTTTFLQIKKHHADLMQSPGFHRMIKWGDLGGEFIFLKQK